MTYSEGNIEEWDFRHCGHDDPTYDNEADLFFMAHFTTAVAVDAIRLQILSTFIEKGFATVDDDREYVRFGSFGDQYLAGWRRATSRWSRGGRFERKVVESLRRENRKYGKLKLTILPPPGRQRTAEFDRPARVTPNDGVEATGFVSRKKAGYAAAVRVERYRGAAEALRRDDPATYARVLQQADGSEAEDAAARDPDAYVALFLAAASDAGVSESATEELQQTDSDRWPDLDLQGVFSRVGEMFADVEREKGAPQYYPQWFVQRYVGVQVLAEAGLSDPEVAHDLDSLFGDRDFMEEDSQLDQRVEEMTRRYDLDRAVGAIVQALSDTGAP